MGLSKYCFRSVYAEFARVLSEMPNLVAVQIFDAPVNTWDRPRAVILDGALAQAMAKGKYIYKTVKVLSCVIQCLSIAPHFPLVDHVTLLHSRPHSSDVRCTSAGATSDWFYGFRYFSPSWVNSRCWDNVRILDISSSLYLHVKSADIYEGETIILHYQCAITC